MNEHIVVGESVPRIQYVGDGAQAAFAFPFPVFEVADLKVFVDAAEQSTGFTVSGAGESAGGTVTFDTVPPEGARITLLRRVPIRRTTDFQAGGAFRANTVNDELDRQTAMIQQVEFDITRSIRLGDDDEIATLTPLPGVSARANGLVGFDAAGGLLIAGGTSGDVTISTAMTPVVQAQTSAAARSAMGAQDQDDALDAIAGLTLAQGQLLYVDANGGIAALAPGTAGQLLKTNGAGANPVWATANATDAGARSDIRLLALKQAADDGDRINMTDGIADPFADQGDVDAGTPITPVRLDGSDDRYERSAELTGMADGQKGILALTLDMKGGDGTTQYIFTNQGTVLRLERLTSNKLVLFGFNTATSQVLKIQTTSEIKSTTGRINLLVSWDLNAGVSHLYVNDLDDKDAAQSPMSPGNTIDYTRGNNWAVGFRQDTSTSFTNAEIGFLYFNAVAYLDFSVEANRRKFFAANGKVADLGADGSTPTGAAPIVYLKGGVADFGTNLGSGGDFTATGGPVDGTGDVRVDDGASTGETYNPAGHFYETLVKPVTANANAGGTGDRSGSITVTSNIAFSAGTASNLVDGAFANNANDSTGLPADPITGKFIQFDFGGGNKKYIDEFKPYFGGSPGGDWKWQASDDATNWTDVSARFTMPANSETVEPGTITNRRGYRYYRLLGISGTMATIWLEEFEFKIADGNTPNDMTLTSRAFTAGAQPDIGRIHVQVKENEAIAINTDLTAEISRDGGTTWTTATLVKVGDLADGTVACEDNAVNVSGQPPGTAMKWRVRTANTKDIQVHGVVLQWA